MQTLPSRLLATLLLLWIGQQPGLAVEPETITFKIAREAENISGELYRPDGAGPFPAVVLLHGCAGIHPHHHRWARLFNDWGYVAFVIDSLGPRHVEDTCENPFSISPALRQLDALGALIYLRSQAYVLADKVALAGWSHGGWTALKTVGPQGMWRYLEDLPGGTFAGAATIYPSCVTSAFFVKPVQINIGAADTLTLAKHCQDLLANKHQNSAEIELITYPDALHWYDNGEPIKEISGHMMGQNDAATAKTEQAIKRWLQELFAP